ncbi:unnamed protein product, partial [Rotaria socialis]
GRSGPTNGPPNGCADPRYGCSVVVLFVVLAVESAKGTTWNRRSHPTATDPQGSAQQ